MTRAHAHGSRQRMGAAGRALHSTAPCMQNTNGISVSLDKPCMYRALASSAVPALAVEFVELVMLRVPSQPGSLVLNHCTKELPTPRPKDPSVGPHCEFYTTKPRSG